MAHVDREKLAYFLSKLQTWVASYAPSKDVATSYSPGLMSPSDKAKLDGLNVDPALNAASANPVQNRAVAQALQGYGDRISALEDAGSTTYTYKGSVPTKADLPATGNQIGDVYDVLTAPDDGSWAWNGSDWSKLSGFVDLSALATKDVATPVSNGLMSAADKASFDALMQGFVPLWSQSSDYLASYLVRGSDGALYFSKQASGPGTAAFARNPVDDAAGAYWGRVSVDDAALLHRSGDETVAGQKTFLQPIAGDVTGSAATAAYASSAGSADYASEAGGFAPWSATANYSDAAVVLGSDGNLYFAASASGPSSGGASDPVSDGGAHWTKLAVDDSGFVHLSGSETVGGAKTFSSPVVADVRTAAAGTGAVSRLLSDRAADVASVADFGAVPGDASDDSAAFQAAADAADGALPLVPKGSYSIASPVDGKFFSLGGATQSSRNAEIVDKSVSGTHAPFDIFGGMQNAEIVLSSDQRGTGTYSRGAVQSAVYDPTGDQVFLLHLKGSIDGGDARYGSISRHKLTPDVEVGTDGISADLATVGHQGLAVEVLPEGGIKLWSSHNYGLHGGTALRFDYADGQSIQNVQEYVLADYSGNLSLTPCISMDQRLLLAVYRRNSTSFVRVFDLAKLREGGPGDYTSDYITEFPVYPLKASGSAGFQAMACDGWHVYILASDTQTTMPAAIYCYTVQGELVSKNLNVTLGFDKSAAAGSTWCEAEALLIMPVNGAPRLCVGVDVASSSSDDSPTKYFHIYALGGGGWKQNIPYDSMRYIPEGANLDTFTKAGAWFKPVETSVQNWPSSAGLNGILLNFGGWKNSGGCIMQFVIRMGTMDGNNYMCAYRTNYNGTASRWWYPGTLFARCHVTDAGDLSGRRINVESVTKIDARNFTVNLREPVDISSVVIVAPAHAVDYAVTGSGYVASGGMSIRVTLSNAVPFSLAVF